MKEGRFNDTEEFELVVYISLDQELSKITEKEFIEKLDQYVQEEAKKEHGKAMSIDVLDIAKYEDKSKTPFMYRALIAGSLDYVFENYEPVINRHNELEDPGYTSSGYIESDELASFAEELVSDFLDQNLEEEVSYSCTGEASYVSEERTEYDEDYPDYAEY